MPISNNLIHGRELTGWQAIAEIRALTSEETISTDDEDLLAHGYSEWSTTNIDQMPVAVAYPKTTVEVADIAKICYKYRVPMSWSSLPIL